MLPEPAVYNLLVTVGTSPAVITEVLWLYANAPTSPRLPERVVVLTTLIGHDTIQGELIASGRWRRFCRDVLGDPDLAIEFIVPSRKNGTALSDIQSNDDDMHAANACYRAVDQLTRPGQPPLVGSITGGRRTISAHLMVAFTAFARREDLLVHVLEPQGAAGIQEFDLSDPHAGDDLHMIEMPFPRLAPYLERGFFQHLPPGERDLLAILDGVRKFDYDAPVRATVFAGNGRWHASTIQLWDAGGQPEDSFQLPPQPLLTLLVAAQAIADAGGLAPKSILRDDRAQHRFRAAAFLFIKLHDYAPLETDRKVSAAISRLNDRLASLPMAAEYLTLRTSRRGGKSGYAWCHAEPPALEVVCPPDIADYLHRAGWGELFPAIPMRAMTSEEAAAERRTI